MHEGALTGVTAPIVPASTFAIHDAAHGARLAALPDLAAADGAGYFYGRWANPTGEVAARAIASLEGAQAGARVFSSGMGAIATVLLMGLEQGAWHLAQPMSLRGGHDHKHIDLTVAAYHKPALLHGHVHPRTCHPTYKMTTTTPQNG